MADKPILKVSAKLDRDASRKQIQKDLDAISKSLKVVIGASQTAAKNTSQTIKKETNQISSELEKRKSMYKNMFDSIRTEEGKHAEFAIKSFQSRQKIAKQEEAESLKLEARIQRETDLRQKQADKQQAFYDKSAQSLEKAKIKAQALLDVMSHFGTSSQTAKATELNNSLQRLAITEDMTETQIRQTNTQLALQQERLRAVSNEARATGKSSLKLGEMFKTAFKSFAIWISATTIFFGAIRAIKNGINTIVELDTAFLELRKVSELTTESFSDFVAQAQSVGETVGRTTTEVTKATAAFARMGFEVKESLGLAEQALLLTNIGDGIDDVTQSTDALIATLKGFEIEADKASHIVDALNEVSNSYAVNTDSLADGVTRISSVMKVAGNSFEETLGLLTASDEAIQNMAKSSTGLRTISLRLQGLNEEGDKLGSVFSAKLQDSFKRIADVDIMLNGELRSTFDILTDLGGTWNTLSKEQQTYLGIQSAGIRQQQVFASTMSNISTAISATETALNSQGSALQENEKFLDSISGKAAIFNQQLETLWTNAINSESIKSIVETGTAILSLVDDIGLLNSVLITTISLFVLFKNKALATSIPGFIEFISSMSVSMTGLTGVIGGATVAFSALRVAMLGAVAIVGLVIAGIVSHKKKQDELRASLRKTTSALSDYNSESGKIESLIKSLGNATKGTEEYLDITGKLNALLPESVDLIDSENQSLEEQVKVYQVLNKEKKESLLDEAKQIILLSKSKEEYIEELKKEQEELKHLKNVRDILIQQDLLGLDPDGELAMDIKRVSENVAELEKELKDLVIATELYDEATGNLDSSLVGITEKHEDLADARKKDMEFQIEQSELGIKLAQLSDEQIEGLVSSYEDLTGAQKTNLENFLKSEKIRLETALKSIRTEIIAREKLILLMTDGMTDVTSFDLTSNKEINQLKDYGDALNEIDGMLESINDMSTTVDTKVKTTVDKEDNKDVLDNLQKEQQAIKDITDEIDILSSKISLAEGEDRVRLQEQLIQKYKEQQDAVHAYANALRDLKSKGGLDDNEIAKINDELVAQGSEWWKLKVSIDGVKDSISSYYTELKQERDNAMQELKDSIREMIEEELSDEIGSRKELIELAKEELDIKLKQIDAEKDLADFADDRADKEEDIAKITNKMNSLKIAASQGDKKAQAELLKLEEDRNKKQEELDELINDRSYELRKEGLENQYDEYEEIQNDEIDLLEEKLKDEEYITKKVNDEINQYLRDNNIVLYEELAQTFENTVISKWEKAIDLVEKYNSAIANSSNSTTSGFTGGGALDTSTSGNFWDDKVGNDGATQAVIDFLNSGTGSESLISKNIDWLMKYGNFSSSNSSNISPSVIPSGAINNNTSSVSAPVSITIQGDVSDNNVARISNDITNTITRSQTQDWKKRGFKPSVSDR